MGKKIWGQTPKTLGKFGDPGNLGTDLGNLDESHGILHTCSRATAFDKARYILNVRNLNGIEIDPETLD